MQGRTAQPATPSPRLLNGVDRGRNTLRKDDEHFSLDWRIARPFRLGGGVEISPTSEMFNTFNNANNISRSRGRRSSTSTGSCAPGRRPAAGAAGSQGHLLGHRSDLVSA
jgi:hypothetical protein